MNVFEQYMQEIGYLKLSVDGTIVDCNNSCLEIISKYPNDLVGNKIDSVLRWTGESYLQLKHHLKQLTDDNIPIKNIVLDYYKDQAISYVEFYGIIVEENQNRYIELCVLNVTQRERNCPKRNRIDLKSRYIQELGGIGTAEVIDDGNYQTMTLGVDSQWKEITGCDEDSVLFVDHLKKIPEMFHVRFQEEKQKVLDGADVFGVTHSFQHPDKGEIWIEAHGRVIERVDNIARSIVMIRDVTSEKKRIDELKSMKKKLEKAIELGNLGYFEVDMITGKVYWDSICYLLHGYPSSTEITYEYFVQKIVHPEDIVTCIERFKKKLPLLQPFLMEYRCIDFDGNVRWMKERVEPIGDSPTNITKIRGAKQEITKEKLKQVELEGFRSQLELSNKRLEEMVTHDELTKIFNRRMFNERFEYEWRRAIRKKTTFSIAIADIDHFKEFNDLYGHLAGDICLSTVAETLANTITRSTDMVARYGGEEFAFILPDTSDPQKLLEKCRRNVEAMAMSHQGTCRNVVTISIGCATQIPLKNLKKNDLLRLADEQLYKAKDQGRNRVCHSHL